MKLYEFEAKQLVAKYKMPVPPFEVVKTASDAKALNGVTFVKAQVLTNKRAKNGAIARCENDSEVKAAAASILGKEFLGERVESVLLEKGVKTDSEHYLSITFDTSARKPVILLSRLGGVNIEEIAAERPEAIARMHVDSTRDFQHWEAKERAIRARFRGEDLAKITGFIEKAWKLFKAEHARLVELNPVAKDVDGDYYAVGALVDLDDSALYYHKSRDYSPRAPAIGRQFSERELEVKRVKESDSSLTINYFELDGDIGVLAAGGGGSLTAMDALTSYGGKPANYAEYSGNPSREKVQALTRAILSRQGLNGLWIVGAIASFTRLDTTLGGIADVLLELKPEYPIVVRRSGPKEREGLEIMKALAVKGLDIEVNGSEVTMASTAKTMAEKEKAYFLGKTAKKVAVGAPSRKPR